MFSGVAASKQKKHTDNLRLVALIIFFKSGRVWPQNTPRNTPRFVLFSKLCLPIQLAFAEMTTPDHFFRLVQPDIYLPKSLHRFFPLKMPMGPWKSKKVLTDSIAHFTFYFGPFSTSRGNYAFLRGKKYAATWAGVYVVGLSKKMIGVVVSANASRIRGFFFENDHKSGGILWSNTPGFEKNN